MMIGKIGTIVSAVSLFVATLAPASAQELGTMSLMPSNSIAVAVSDQELAKHRGGFMGIAFSATFTASVENVTGDVTGTGTSSTSTSGVTNTTQPVNYNIAGGQVQLSTFVGNLSGLNGVFQLTTVNGVGNVVNSHLTLNVALVNLTGGTTLPTMQSLFGQ